MSIDFGGRLPGFKPYFCHLQGQVVQPPCGCKMRAIIVLLRVIVKIK